MDRLASEKSFHSPQPISQRHSGSEMTTHAMRKGAPRALFAPRATSTAFILGTPPQSVKAPPYTGTRRVFRNVIGSRLRS
jgi:hypothetical protein